MRVLVRACVRFRSGDSLDARRRFSVALGFAPSEHPAATRR